MSYVSPRLSAGAPTVLLLLLLLPVLHRLSAASGRGCRGGGGLHDLPLLQLPVEVVRHHPLDLLHVLGAVAGQRLADLPLRNLKGKGRTRMCFP